MYAANNNAHMSELPFLVYNMSSVCARSHVCICVSKFASACELAHVRTAHVRTAHVRTAHVRTAHVRTAHVRTAHVRTDWFLQINLLINGLFQQNFWMKLVHQVDDLTCVSIMYTVCFFCHN